MSESSLDETKPGPADADRASTHEAIHLSEFALDAIRKAVIADHQIDVQSTFECYIRAPNGNYLASVNGGGETGPEVGPHIPALRTNATEVGEFETFQFVILPGTQFALKTAKGFYVTVVGGGGIGNTGPDPRARQPIVSNATFSTPGIRFIVQSVAHSRVTLRTADGRHYVTAVNGGGIQGGAHDPFRTTANVPGPTEHLGAYILCALSKTHNGTNQLHQQARS